MAGRAKAPPAGYSQRSRVDKLGVKPGMRVAMIGVQDPFIRAELLERTDEVSEGRPRKDTNLILFGVDNVKGLSRLPTLVKSLKRDGCIWAIWTKGRKEFREDDIRKFALAHDLVDIKVIAFSESSSGLKLVIPVAKR